MSRPILAVDVDGVISLFGFDEPPDRDGGAGSSWSTGWSTASRSRAGERLLRLGEHFDLVWATGWEEKANDYLPNMLGLPELPVLTFDGAARFGSAHWKLGPLDEYGRGRPLAWIDDNFDESCYEWARGRGPSRPCWSRPSPHLGLEEAHVEALTPGRRASAASV